MLPICKWSCKLFDQSSGYSSTEPKSRLGNMTMSKDEHVCQIIPHFCQVLATVNRFSQLRSKQNIWHSRAWARTYIFSGWKKHFSNLSVQIHFRNGLNCSPARMDGGRGRRTGRQTDTLYSVSARDSILQLPQIRGKVSFRGQIPGVTVVNNNSAISRAFHTARRT